MSWTILTLLSAFFLALYDVCKKASVRENAVLPVLLCSTCFGAVAFTAGLALSGGLIASVAPGARTVLLAMVKSVIVAASWIFTFTALRTLPITIATPIRASSPALVFLVALFLYGEIPTLVQGVGMLLVFAGYWMFSWAGRQEGIDFLRSRAVWCAIAGAVLSAVSSLFDKFVFQCAHVSITGAQLYFQLGLVIVYALVFLLERLRLKIRREPVAHRFEWRWTIPLVGILLAWTDWIYFNALSVPDAPISVVALLRRFSVAITFVLGALLFHESNLRRKALALIAVLTGVVLLCLPN